uniref:Odorant receptor n=1 Tax=Chouioia cunea TaxID=1570515 RepID=A0A6B9CLW2_9HYME|nr:odorant receptor 72 [Chouioia cunea]
MDLYESRYFIINKSLCSIIGLWPYDSILKRHTRKIFPALWVFAFIVPHGIGAVVNQDDIDRFMEHICLIIFLFLIFVKYITAVLTEGKMILVFNDIVDNMEYITDAEEKKILEHYSERGRYVTLVYLFYILNVGVCFTLLPLMPLLWNMLHPDAEPYPRLFLMNGEFLVNRENHYWKIYIWDLLTTFIPGFIVIGVDTTFAACVEHCVGVFEVNRKRLESIVQSDDQTTTDSVDSDAAYSRVCDIVRLHQRAIRFTDTLENAYSQCFLILMLGNMLLMPLLCVMIIMNNNRKIHLIRYAILYTGCAFHLFYISLAGQRIIDYSSNLFYYAYNNEWYTTSSKTKNILRLFMIRCTDPCMLTAGKLMNMSMETFYSVMKTAVSYITVISSFRAG